tara:strand:- start:3411 stop:3683 length:273 start_codon:yes stop_codon:yes gene_type:complete
MAFTESTIDADGTVFTSVSNASATFSSVNPIATTFDTIFSETYYWEDLTATNWEDALVASSSLPLEWDGLTSFSSVNNTATTFTKVAISG